MAGMQVRIGRRGVRLAVAFVAGMSMAAMPALLSGCEKEGPAEKAGKDLDKAAKETGEAVKEAGKKIEDATKPK